MATGEMQKVTVMLPRALIKDALAATGKGLTPTIRIGLERLRPAEACERLRKRRGKVRLQLNVAEMRED